MLFFYTVSSKASNANDWSIFAYDSVRLNLLKGEMSTFFTLINILGYKVHAFKAHVEPVFLKKNYFKDISYIYKVGHSLIRLRRINKVA